MENLLIVIPAIKKNAVIPDQLIKKLNGITLIQRAINTSLELTDRNNVLIVTDSIEISLIAERNGINYFKDSTLTLNSDNIVESIVTITKNYSQCNVLVYRANTPLLSSNVLQDAYHEFLTDSSAILTSVKVSNRNFFEIQNNKLIDIDNKNYVEEIKAFLIFSKFTVYERRYRPYIIESEKSIEIESYQDWWVCEKVLQRKKIVFNVIGSVELGMGHIYHSLALAHEIMDHEIIFVCDNQYKIAVDAIASMDYRVISTENTLKTIIELSPDLVINDILNTQAEFILPLKQHNIKIVNFEDLGEGSKYADLVFNELYDLPQCEGENYHWGHQYLALRDEFYEAAPHSFIEEVHEILITFGGTDQNNLTLLTLKGIIDLCKNNNIKINIVCGSGYMYRELLETYLHSHEYKNFELIFSSGIISKLMEKTQIAISSNGRTVYELADMNIPSIIVSHHEREASHTFATLEKGFINLGVLNESTPKMIRKKFEKLIDDNDYRELLFMNIKKYTFRENKQKVVRKILELL